MAGVRACVNAALAQSAERLTRNEKVEGSIPSGGSLSVKSFSQFEVDELGGLDSVAR